MVKFGRKLKYTDMVINLLLWGYLVENILALHEAWGAEISQKCGGSNDKASAVCHLIRTVDEIGSCIGLLEKRFCNFFREASINYCCASAGEFCKEEKERSSELWSAEDDSFMRGFICKDNFQGLITDYTKKWINWNCSDLIARFKCSGDPLYLPEIKTACPSNW